MTQPVKWKDAGKTLNHPALEGCHMPDGPGQAVAHAGACLQYNEVSTACLIILLILLWYPFISILSTTPLKSGCGTC